MSIVLSPYIKEEYKENIRNYKYRGSDNSLLNGILSISSRIKITYFFMKAQ